VTRCAAAIIVLVTSAGCNGDFERMRVQPKYEPFAASTIFADGKVLQHAPAGTVAVERDPRPAAIDLALVQTGRVRFDVYCSPCHGVLGDAQTPVAARMPLRQPPSLHEDRIRTMGDEEIYTVISNGYGFMPPYATQLSERERWGVVGYVRALQRSHATSLESLPPEVRGEAQAALTGEPR